MDLTTKRADGTRAIRNRETNLGDLCADAYRAISGADIALVNGGGIRADIPAGDITYGQIIKVHPYGNALCVVEATGQEIIDALEWTARNTMSTYSDGENPSAKWAASCRSRPEVHHRHHSQVLGQGRRQVHVRLR